MHLSRSLAAAFLVVLAACAHGGGSPPAAPDRHDAAVYRAVLASVRPLVVQRTTRGPPESGSFGSAEERIGELAGILRGLDSTTVQSFLTRSRTPAPLPELGDSTLLWMTDEEWRAFTLRPGGWETLYARHPGSGVIILSRVGYSRDGTQALVYVSTVCPFCGSGEYVLLVRGGDRWTIAARAEDWIS